MTGDLVNDAETLSNNDPDQKITEKTDPKYDIAIYSGTLNYLDPSLREWIYQDNKKDVNCLFVLATLGGSADIAYLIGSVLQNKYKELTVIIPYSCKSAGTLVCIGAKNLIFGKRGELGPLDVQLAQKDELFDFKSGTIYQHSLAILREESFALFEETFLKLIKKSDNCITTISAAKLAIDLTIGLLNPIYSQINPLQLGDTIRSLQIAAEYGRRLDSAYRNLIGDALDMLLNYYPSHQFIIDIREAKKLFKNVEDASGFITEIIDKLWVPIVLGVHTEKLFFNVLAEDICFSDIPSAISKFNF
jgi:hypothetical protein